MRVIKSRGWVYYINDECNLDSSKVGKWMCFFSDNTLIANICADALAKNITSQSKHSDLEEGVACFYLNCDDTNAHKKVILYLLENNLIRKTKTGRLYDISFKLDKQSLSGEYAGKFHSDIKLSKFVDLNTGAWLL